MNPNRAEIGSKFKSIFSIKFLFQLFSIGAIFLFLLSNLFQPNLWSINTVDAKVPSTGPGLGIRFDDQPYSTSLASSIINDQGSPTPAGQISSELRVFHCRQQAGGNCAPDLTPGDFMTEQRFPVTFTAPAPGSESRMIFSTPAFNPSCGRVQVDVGGDNGVYGGKTFPLSGDCGSVPPPGGGQCTYSSTQARWQQNINDPWGDSKTITQGQTARVGSFHNGDGRLATDTTLTVTGPGTSGTTLSNEGVFTPPQSGTYQLKVTTNGQSGTNCEATATLTVNPGTPANQCPYGSTQARWQQNINDPWGQSKTANVNQQVTAGGFHNNTGSFPNPNDVILTVTGPGTNNPIGSNPGNFTPTQAGTYQLKVTTNNVTGVPACEDTAALTVSGAPAPTCTWTSTQARVQKNISDPWESTKTINEGDQIRLGGFHDATGRLASASDIALNVTGPANFSNQGNGSFITITQAGTYTLTATTPNQSGAACQDTAAFTAQSAACVPDNTCTASEPACGTTTTGENNCGQPCTKTGAACVSGCTVDTNSCSAQMPSACGQINTGRDNCGNVCFKQSAACQAGGPGPVNINPVFNNNPNNTNNNNNNITIQGNVGVGTPQVAGVTTLPKTGLSELAWSALAFIPAGFGMRRFRSGGLKKTLEDDPTYILEDRKFKTDLDTGK